MLAAYDCNLIEGVASGVVSYVTVCVVLIRLVFHRGYKSTLFTWRLNFSDPFEQLFIRTHGCHTEAHHDFAGPSCQEMWYIV